MMAGGAPTEPLVTRYAMDVRKVERVYKTRKSVMNATKKTYTFLFDVLKLIKSREEAARLKERGIDSTKSQPAKFVGMYNRYDQERFGKLNEFQTMGTSSFVGTNLSSISTLENRPLDGYMKVILLNSGCLQLWRIRSQKRRSEEPPWLRRYLKPFLCLLPYLIVDQPNKFTDAEWDRVVAVFITGQLWQFKPFKRWHSNPVEIFAKIPAFHVHYDDLNIDPNVAKWSVTRLPVSRTTRHMDKARFRVFWEVLDRWIPANRPHLRW
ncbi:RNA pol II accessory factor, Cdc73 family [Teladorsagia circumcincta]|uniref:RNA pol II accessory factor, Cdc73 family n=1 Tax=Teladorsagia circumcincta TaxID=45464 RepID=A0A2G9V2F5_TELCI|nr:RNA pol II accessory factor, Cdc73 family [Teladorsagia circumcincta]